MAITETPTGLEPEQIVPLTLSVAKGAGEAVGAGVGPGTVGFGHGEAVGGTGEAVGEGVGLGLTVGVGLGEGVMMGWVVGEGLGVGVIQPTTQNGVGEGDGLGEGVGLGEGLGVGVVPIAGSGPMLRFAKGPVAAITAPRTSAAHSPGRTKRFIEPSKAR